MLPQLAEPHDGCKRNIRDTCPALKVYAGGENHGACVSRRGIAGPRTVHDVASLDCASAQHARARPLGGVHTPCLVTVVTCQGIAPGHRQGSRRGPIENAHRRLDLAVPKGRRRRPRASVLARLRSDGHDTRSRDIRHGSQPDIRMFLEHKAFFRGYVQRGHIFGGTCPSPPSMTTPAVSPIIFND